MEWGDETEMTFEQVCNEIRDLLDEIPTERWVWTRNDGSPYELAAILGQNMGMGQSHALFGIALDDGALRERGEARMVCFTGNGPNSERHARLLMLVRAALPELLARAKVGGDDG